MIPGEYAAVFAVGLLGALHCMAMCGGLMAACAMKFGGGPRFAVVYNTGRLLSYMLIGALMGGLGKTLSAVGPAGGLQRVVPVAAGAVMVLVGIELLGWMPPRLRRFFTGLFPGGLSDRLVGAGLRRGSTGPLLLGMLNGLVPCGLTYAVGVKAAATADPFSGMFVMAAFGAGTLPALLMAGSLTGLLARMRSRAFTAASSVIIIVLGIRSIVATAYLH
ncbi:MAG TPA: sulfite exporter TauE/SafE family protein [Deltaproteobacteria bacterium]|nr:sulfite exporter TauE/SafE family protein [Deltaproteobacteria bacterium]